MRGYVVNEMESTGTALMESTGTTLMPQSSVNSCFQGMVSQVFLTKTFQWQRLNNAKLDAKLVTDDEFGRNIPLQEHKHITKTNVFCDVRQYSLVEIY